MVTRAKWDQIHRLRRAIKHSWYPGKILKQTRLLNKLEMEEYKKLLDHSISDIERSDIYKSLTKGEFESLKDVESHAKNRKSMIKSIEKNIRLFNKPIKNSKCPTLLESDIDLFYDSQSKNCNDVNNKKREYIIKRLSQGDPYPNNDKWVILSEQFNIYLNKLKYLIGEQSHQVVHRHSIKTKGGRGYHYDFLITFYDVNNNSLGEYKIEFKNNACDVNDCPQYVSPMKASKYFDCVKTYEYMYYDEFLPSICAQVLIPIPDKELYMKQIHCNKPECMKTFQEAYYRGSKQSSKYTGLDEDINNYNYMNEKSRESIKKFLSMNQLNISKMNEYLMNTQEGKKYMLWGNNEFHYQEVNKDDYTIMDILRIKKDNTVVCLTKSNKEMNILLRWKNGNGVAFPALQIS